MRFIKFEINNFKGIEHIVVDMVPTGSNVFTLIGLNESGKTTVLEAIGLVGRADSNTKALYATEGDIDEPENLVPKSRLSNFTGEITSTAILSMSDAERAEIITALEAERKCKIELTSIPTKVSIQRGYEYVNSDKKVLFQYLTYP